MCYTDTRQTWEEHSEAQWVRLDHSPSSLSAVFTCTPDIVPTLTLTMFRIGVCALLAVSSFEGASSAPFSYGTILRIAVIAKSTAAYPVGRLFSCV